MCCCYHQRRTGLSAGSCGSHCRPLLVQDGRRLWLGELPAGVLSLNSRCVGCPAALLCRAAAVCGGLPDDDLLEGTGRWSTDCADSIVVGGSCPGICAQGELVWVRMASSSSPLRVGQQHARIATGGATSSVFGCVSRALHSCCARHGLHRDPKPYTAHERMCMRGCLRKCVPVAPPRCTRPAQATLAAQPSPAAAPLSALTSLAGPPASVASASRPAPLSAASPAPPSPPAPSTTVYGPTRASTLRLARAAGRHARSATPQRRCPAWSASPTACGQRSWRAPATEVRAWWSLVPAGVFSEQTCQPAARAKAQEFCVAHPWGQPEYFFGVGQTKTLLGWWRADTRLPLNTRPIVLYVPTCTPHMMCPSAAVCPNLPDPTLLLAGSWDPSCASSVRIGGTCSAQCPAGFNGGATVICQSGPAGSVDAEWSRSITGLGCYNASGVLS